MHPKVRSIVLDTRHLEHKNNSLEYQRKPEQSLTQKSSNDSRSILESLIRKKDSATVTKLILLSIVVTYLVLVQASVPPVEANVLMRVCDTREIKTVTSRVCMLYKRTQNSDVKMDKQGNIKFTSDSKQDYSPAKLANECCKIGCPAHIFAYNC